VVEAAEEAEAVAAGRGTAGQNYLQLYWNKSILPMVGLKHGSENNVQDLQNVMEDTAIAKTREKPLG